MGYLEDQRLPSERAEQGESPPPAYTASAARPRHSSPDEELRIHANTQEATAGGVGGGAGSSGYYRSSVDGSRYGNSSSYEDARNKSTDSLVPQTNRDGRRKLLLIYLHGFMGDETSFQSFPAHVHHLATDLMSGTHIVHTKIYPKYKSRRAIEFARDEFSDWLRPHESAHTDVVLLGHSMGGILSAEVVLKPAAVPQSSPFAHRILGIINFDVPFLGMHPGVIASGLGSLFRPGAKSPDLGTMVSQDDLSIMSAEANGSGSLISDSGIAYRAASPETQSSASINQASRSMSQLSIPIDDPNYNPQFENDVIRPVRKGWESALYFMNKHSGSLRQAAKAYVTSHVEFGGTMADYPKLHARYNKIRALEDVNDEYRVGNNSSRTPRVRFVNFYTASTGIQSKARTKSAPGDNHARKSSLKEASQTPEEHNLTNSISAGADRPITPMISVENSENENNTNQAELDESLDLQALGAKEEDISNIDPKAEQDTTHELSKVDPKAEQDATQDSTTNQTPSTTLEDLPPIPAEPTKPLDFDPTAYHDKDVLKLAEKDHSRKMKAYQSAVKDREKAIADRQKMLEKRQKKAAKEEEKAAKEKQKAAKEEAKAAEKAAKLKEKQEQAKAVETSAELARFTESSSSRQQHHLLENTTTTTTDQEKSNEVSKEKKARDHKFCITPSKQGGKMDPTWIRVFMEGVDEVSAHCGLFFQDKAHYENLVKDVGTLIVEWVARDDFLRNTR